MVSSSLFHAGIYCSVFISFASFFSLRGHFLFSSLDLFLSPASLSPLFSCLQFALHCRCCACWSPNLVTYLPSPWFRGAVPFATFLLLLSFACTFFEGVVIPFRFPHFSGFILLAALFLIHWFAFHWCCCFLYSAPFTAYISLPLGWYSSSLRIVALSWVVRGRVSSSYFFLFSEQSLFFFYFPGKFLLFPIFSINFIIIRKIYIVLRCCRAHPTNHFLFFLFFRFVYCNSLNILILFMNVTVVNCMVSVNSWPLILMNNFLFFIQVTLVAAYSLW